MNDPTKGVGQPMVVTPLGVPPSLSS